MVAQFGLKLNRKKSVVKVLAGSHSSFPKKIESLKFTTFSFSPCFFYPDGSLQFPGVDLDDEQRTKISAEIRLRIWFGLESQSATWHTLHTDADVEVLGETVSDVTLLHNSAHDVIVFGMRESSSIGRPLN